MATANYRKGSENTKHTLLYFKHTYFSLVSPNLARQSPKVRDRSPKWTWEPVYSSADSARTCLASSPRGCVALAGFRSPALILRVEPVRTGSSGLCDGECWLLLPGEGDSADGTRDLWTITRSRSNGNWSWAGVSTPYLCSELECLSLWRARLSIPSDVLAYFPINKFPSERLYYPLQNWTILMNSTSPQKIAPLMSKSIVWCGLCWVILVAWAWQSLYSNDAITTNPLYPVVKLPLKVSTGRTAGIVS